MKPPLLTNFHKYLFRKHRCTCTHLNMSRWEQSFYNVYKDLPDFSQFIAKTNRSFKWQENRCSSSLKKFVDLFCKRSNWHLLKYVLSMFWEKLFLHCAYPIEYYSIYDFFYNRAREVNHNFLNEKKWRWRNTSIH